MALEEEEILFGDVDQVFAEVVVDRALGVAGELDGRAGEVSSASQGVRLVELVLEA
jgi:hypothetical protein